MKVNVLKLHPDAVVPSKKHRKDFCCDCVAVWEKEIHPGVWQYGLGLAFQIERPRPDINVLLGIDARPRSSICHTGMILSNCEGTIDEEYTGEVTATFYHVMPNLPRYKVGDRVVQIKIGSAFPMEFEVVDSLKETSRGANGYGSTGRGGSL